jgi:bifunctional aspartokinase / homoserine dehydrogenase 1
MRIVHKFGGTSVGDAGCIAHVADIVLTQGQGAEEGRRAQTVVVVSAMSGVTDRLIAGARAAAEGRDADYRRVKADLLARHLEVVEALLTRSPERLSVGGLVEDRLHDLERFYRSIALLGEVTARGLDAVASFGELLSAHILAAVLRERGVRAQALSATDLIVTDDAFGAATPRMDLTRQRLQGEVVPLLERGVIPVITGFIGATEQGVTTTLGRGGSDYAAAIVGAGLDADEVWIWSDVDGILTADPNLVPGARTLAELSYAEAASLAYYGADVLHPKTMRPVVQSGIPLRILNTFRPEHPGTRIVERPDGGRTLWPAIISSGSLSLIAVGSDDDSWVLPMAAHALQQLARAGVDVLMFSQSFSEHSLNLIVRQQDRGHCLRTLRREFGVVAPADGSPVGRSAGPCVLGSTERVATVSVVGVSAWNGNGRRSAPAGGSLASLAFGALGRCGTRVIAVAQAASRPAAGRPGAAGQPAATEQAVSFCIPEEQMADTVRFLHRELGLEEER